METKTFFFYFFALTGGFSKWFAERAPGPFSFSSVFQAVVQLFFFQDPSINAVNQVFIQWR